MPIRERVFVSYSHCDRAWLERLQRMLKPLLRRGRVALWDDTAIRAGDHWLEEIEDALAAARVAVLLVSADFLASDFIAEHELPPLLRAAEEQGVRILWVYLSPCLYEETPIRHYQAAYDPAQALTELSAPEQDRVLKRIAQRIRQASEETLRTAGSVALKKLSERHEVLSLPESGDGIARVLSLHLGPSAVVGRAYASQLRENACAALWALGEDRVHWVLAWDDDRLNQIIARLYCRTMQEGISLEIRNLTDYSTRKQSFSVTAETSSELLIRAGEQAQVPVAPDIALTLTSGAGSGRQQLLRLVVKVEFRGGVRIPVIRTEATAFLFTPRWAEDATLVRYLGAWISLGHEELRQRLDRDREPIRIRFVAEDVELLITSVAGRLRLESNELDLPQLLEVQ